MSTTSATNREIPLKTLEPNNTDAEAAILGSCLASPRSFDRLQGAIEKVDFYEVVYADTWVAMLDMAKNNRRADLITLAPLLKDRKVGEVLAIEHLQLLVEMYSGKGRLSNDDLDAYISELHRYATQRLIAQAGRDLTDKALGIEPDISDLATGAFSAVDFAIARARTKNTWGKAADFARQALRDFLDPNTPAGISTGLKDLDAISGGLHRGEMSIVGGRPGQGKTTVATQLALNAAGSGVGALVISLEMGNAQLMQRALSNLAFRRDREPIPYSLFRTDKIASPEKRKIGEAEVERLQNSITALEAMPLFLEDKAGLTLAEIAGIVRKTRAHCDKQGIGLGLVVVDHIGLALPTDRYKGSKVNEVSELTAGLKRLAKSLDVHVMALQQLSREVEKRDEKRPQLSDLRDSGSSEQDADVVLFPFREAYYLEQQNPDDPISRQKRDDRLFEVKNRIEINFGKNRSGSVGGAVFETHMDCSLVRDLPK
ncbi:replicative DNA helicase [Hyphomicrobium sp.]|jgi:replicative DNA helicase|uniref:replicative DNA helicase n=1 Tax=Hyphomicrobium sp. TaxID=82 RepID=UPI003567D5AC